MGARQMKMKRNYSVGKDGKKLPSVTEILSKHLGWKAPGLYGYFYARGKAGEPMNAHRDAAGKKGSCVHDLVAAHYDPVNHGDLSEWSDSQMHEARPNADRVIAEITRRKWSVTGVELQMESESFAGTTDMVVRDKAGEVIIVDLKTSAGCYPEHVIQVGAYAWLHRIRCLRLICASDFATSGAVIHAPFGGELSVRPVSPAALVAGEQAFRLLLQLEEITHQIKLGDAE